jgi:hypothetical protein
MEQFGAGGSAWVEARYLESTTAFEAASVTVLRTGAAAAAERIRPANAGLRRG